MHKWAKEIMECLKAKVSAKGVDNMDIADLEEFKNWACVAKDIAEFDYYYHITDAMEKPENKYGENYDENGKYYTQPRNSIGQYMSRRTYEGDYNPNRMMEQRDMDSHMGRMYYSGSGSNMESRYERARRGYEEAKEVDPNGDHMKHIEKMMDSLEEEMRELKPKMAQNEKTIARNKLTSMSNMLM